MGARIPCTLDEYNASNPKQRYAFTILAIAKPGSGYAPFKTKGPDGKTVKDKNAKNLVEMEGRNAVKLYRSVVCALTSRCDK